MLGSIWGIRLVYIAIALICVGATSFFSFGSNSRKVISGRETNCLLTYIVITVFFSFIWGDTRITYQKLIAIAVSIALYELVLMLLIGRLRRICSARVTSSLWALSSILYMFLICGAFHGIDVLPVYLVRIPKRALLGIFIVWLAGFILYMGRAIIDHFSYKKYLDEESYMLTEDSGDFRYTIFKDELDKMLADKDSSPLAKSHLKVSRNTDAPVSIGINAVEVVLPEREYTEEELRLIFRHEFTHIYYCDSNLKVFITVVNAIFWFIPVLSRTQKNVAEDIELACDEMVLEGADEEERRKYSELILSAAASPRGFTSCLSADGQSLRYRLKSIMKPKETNKYVGTLIIVVMTVFIAGTFNLVGFTYDYGSIAMSEFGYRIEADDIRIIQGNSTRSELAKLLNNDKASYIGSDCYFNDEKEIEAVINGSNYVMYVTDYTVGVLNVDRMNASIDDPDADPYKYKYYYIK